MGATREQRIQTQAQRIARQDRIRQALGEVRYGLSMLVVKMTTAKLRAALRDPQFDRADRGVIYDWLLYRVQQSDRKRGRRLPARVYAAQRRAREEWGL